MKWLLEKQITQIKHSASVLKKNYPFTGKPSPITSLYPSVGKVLKTPASLYKNFTPQKWSFVGENSTFSAACLFPKLANVQRVKAIEVGSPARGFPFSEELGPAVHTV